jgi:hypothetical protein
MSHRTDPDLQAYLDAELDSAKAAETASHLMRCTECRARLGELRLASERFRTALAELDTALPSDAVATPRPAITREMNEDRSASTSRPRIRRFGQFGGRPALRAAVLLLAVAGVATAVVPGSPLRLLIDRLVSDDVVSAPVDTTEPRSVPEVTSPGITSVTVSPVDGRVRVVVRQFPTGTTLRVRFGTGTDVRARLISGQDGVEFSVGTGSLFVVGSDSTEPSEILFELPSGLNSATLEVDGKRELVASQGEFRRPGDSGVLPQDEVVLRVGG